VLMRFKCRRFIHRLCWDGPVHLSSGTYDEPRVVYPNLNDGVWVRCVCFWGGILVLAAPDTALGAVLKTASIVV